MSPDYTTKFFDKNVMRHLPEQHICVMLTKALINDDTALCYHSNTSLELTKNALEQALENVNRRINNAEG